jgi:predicted alpha-1,2-mannosidase
MVTNRQARHSSEFPILDRGAPAHVVTGRPGIGLVSAKPWRLRVPEGEHAYCLPIEHPAVGRVIARGDELRWALLPQGLPDDVSDAVELADLDDLWDGTAVSVDLVLDGGDLLSDFGALDQYQGGIGPTAQAAARRTWVDQWNLRRVRLDELAGRRIAGVQVTVQASPRRPLTTYLDDIDIRPAPNLPADPVDRVRTTRGSNSAFPFSRGNTAPLVGVPHGTTYATPVTDAASHEWVYRWQPDGPDGDPRPHLQGLATSHLPSPWIGEHGAFQVMPALGHAPVTGRTERALAFDHDTESDRPYSWRARLAGGIDVELTADDTTSAVRCVFPQPGASIILDHRGSVTDLAIDLGPDGLTLTCLLEDRPERPAHHVHLRIPAAVGHTLVCDAATLHGAVQVEASDAVDVLIGLSTLDAGTAAAHVRRSGGFDEIRARTRARWQQALGAIDVEGATDDQFVALASGLYRLFLYPTRHDEPTADGRSWASPYGSRRGTGPYSATNGFWDTYRTAWPLLGLLTPADAGELADGFLAHARDGGWMPRWSAPGAVDCMTGTTSDTVLADLAVAGVPGFDTQEAWRSALTNATVPASDPRVGRKGLHPGLFRGYVSTATPEGMSWTLDAALNDWSASQLGRAVAEWLPPGPERDRVSAEVDWLSRRSLQYRSVFQPESGFFVGRDDDGSWRAAADELDPAEWGGDYTETNAWGTAVTVPHDGAGLADLHGGEDALAAKVDAILAHRETGSITKAGSYGTVLHEMTEARDCRMGMVALSNQPAHHIPFMYMHAGRHDDAHAAIADALDRLFVGSDLGQGYPGDEDNGEMSAWWIFTTIGLYPLVPASGTWVLTPPRVARTVLRPDGGAPVVIEVPNFRHGWGYIASVLVDGEPWEEIWLPQKLLARGTTITIELADTPQGWASPSRPPSARDVHGFTEPLRDVTAGARTAYPALVDDLGAEPVHLEAGQAVELVLVEPSVLGNLMTVTADVPGTFGWSLAALSDSGWTEVDVRDAEPIEHPGQTRVFRTRPPDVPVTRLRITPAGPMALRQIEVFAP